jgi:glyoxylase-like metal-dependent hydrolase (beta-lactamase superfamily II)
MAATASSLIFDTSFDARVGEPVQVAPRVVRVTAPNPSPLTFTGTNTYLLGHARLAIVDPGPNDTRHLDALRAAIAGRPVDAILLTHTHKDHSSLAQRLRAMTAAPLWFEGQYRPSRDRRPFEIDWVARAHERELQPDRRLGDREVIDVGDLRLEVVATPGHCANHLCFGIVDTSWLLSGDHVMGWNSTMIAVPDGSMADYLASLRKLVDLPYRHYLPGHGGPIGDGRETARALGQHRELRNVQVIQAVRKGARTIGELVAAIYPKLDLAIIPAARMTLAAHVEYLADAGKLRARRGMLGVRLEPV